MAKLKLELPDDAELKELQNAIAYEFKDKSLLKLALIHKSAGEGRDNFECNERLEWLGDRVLGLLSAEFLYANHPTFEEGNLTKAFNKCVSGANCAVSARKINLQKLVVVSKSVMQNQGVNDNILADAYEALIGAIYLDGGKDYAWKLVELAIKTASEAPDDGKNYKSMLQEWLQKRGHDAPKYSVVNREGPDHAQVFTVEVTAIGQSLCAKAGSKQVAQQICAKEFYEKVIKNADK